MKRILLSFFLHFLLISGVAVPTQHVDIARTGTNTQEYALTPNTVSSATFGKLFTVNLDNPVAGQPLYVQNVLVNGSLHNVVYVLTNNGAVDDSSSSVFAIDADKGTVLWRSVLLNNAISMTATPVIDVNNFIIYVVSKDIVSTGNVLLWAINSQTGAQLANTIVTATVPGTGSDAVDGQITFGPGHEDSRGGLLLLNGVVYAGFGGGLPGFHVSPYHGWLFAYSFTPAAGFTQLNVWISTPATTAGGVWQAGKGFSSDGTNIFVSTGYGDFNPAVNDMAMSFIKFAPDLTVLDYFSPAKEATFSAAQEDTGNAGMIVLPGVEGILWAGGTKYNEGHLINSQNMGKFSSVADTCIQTISIYSTHPTGQAPVAWDGGQVNNRNLFVWPIGNDILQYTYTNSSVTLAGIQGVTVGGSLAVSANGQTNGILWAVGNGTAYALLASDISQILWTSEQIPSRDALPSIAGHFQFPTVVNGKFYVPVSGPQLVAYGLLTPAEVALQFIVQPLSMAGTDQVTVNQVLANFQVAVVSATGAVVPSAYSVTISVGGGPYAVTPIINGNLTQPCVNGIATFSGISFSTIGVYFLNAVTPTLTPAQSNNIISASIPIAAGSSSAAANIVPQTSNTVSTTTIIGAVVGSILGLICLICLFAAAIIFYREKKLRDEEKNYVYNPNIHLTAPGDLKPIPTMPLGDIQRLRMDTVRQ